jgi:hypothetical protein
MSVGRRQRKGRGDRRAQPAIQILSRRPLAGSGARIPLANDNTMHQVRVVIGSETPRAPNYGTL